ncbi:hypothetical protein POG14_10600 [Clostridium paraputrificum]|uniref:hypothetical protein n=1 Tax=Clostridium paraputrificum TaxID=29363 RepID=UPI0018986029|nr:hypothetical protein [Clostridium paraputrificum]MDC0802634.1 hypothetical protein [Clostridium paraputrificum]
MDIVELNKQLLKKREGYSKISEDLFNILYKRELEYKKGYEHFESLEEILENKIIDDNMKTTYDVAKEIYKLIDSCVIPIGKEDKRYIIEYINIKLIIMKNQASKNFILDSRNKILNKSKKGVLEKYSRYKVIQYMIIPRMDEEIEFDNEERMYTGSYIDKQKHYQCSFRNYLKYKESDYINELTLVPNILSYIHLCEKRKYRNINKEAYRNIIKNRGEFNLNDLINFYDDLDEFINSTNKELLNKGIELDDYNRYQYIGYLLFENEFKLNRYLLVIELVNEYNITIDYKVSLYLGIILSIENVRMSEHKIREIVKCIVNRDDDRCEEIINELLAFKEITNNSIRKYILHIAYKLKDIEVEYKGISKYYSDNLKRRKRIKNYDKEKLEYIFNNVRIAENFLENDFILEYIRSDRLHTINSKFGYRSVFSGKSSILYLILGAFIQYCRE